MQTQIDSNIGCEAVGYVLNSGFSRSTQEVILGIQQMLEENFPGTLWFPPQDSLHVTLLDWFAPLVTYTKEKDALYLENRDHYISVLKELISAQPPIQINFNEIRVSPSAIIIKADDDGSYQRIRDGFIRKVTLEEGTKPPPQIVHSSIARFINETDSEAMAKFLQTVEVDFTETIDKFRLVRETKIPMLKYEVLQEFDLEKF